MSEPSRLEAAQQHESSTEGEWYRSPFALVAGLGLFVGVLALIVLAVGGDDAADAPADVVSAPANTTEQDSGTRPVATVGPISFGGLDIPEVDFVTLDGPALPPLGDGEDTAIGTVAPAITATSLGNGAPITLDGGRARVIGFFAHWCPHCQRELPEVTEWLAENELPPNTEFIAVSTAVNPDADNYPPSAWFVEVGWTAPVIVDDANGTLLKGLGFTGFPAFIAIDSSGVVVDRAGGNIGTDGLAELFAQFAS